MREFHCPYLKNATALAHERGLLPKNEILTCDLVGECTKVNCQRIEDPNFITIYIKQEGVDISSPVDRFFNRLDQWKNKQVQQINQ